MVVCFCDFICYPSRYFQPCQSFTGDCSYQGLVPCPHDTIIMDAYHGMHNNNQFQWRVRRLHGAFKLNSRTRTSTSRTFKSKSSQNSLRFSQLFLLGFKNSLLLSLIFPTTVAYLYIFLAALILGVGQVSLLLLFLNDSSYSHTNFGTTRDALSSIT